MSNIYLKPSNATELTAILGEAILLYEKVFVDIGSKVQLNSYLMDLYAKIDINSLEYLLQNEILNFTYLGNTPILGIKGIKNSETEMVHINSTKNYKLETPFASFEDLIYEQLKPVINKENTELVISNTRELELDLDNIILEAYKDITSDNFKNYVEQFYIKKFSTLGCEFIVNDQFIMLNNEDLYSKYATEELFDIIQNWIWSYIHIHISSKFDNVNSKIEYKPIIDLKVSSLINNNKENINDNFSKLFQLHNFPDIKISIQQGNIGFNDIIKLREKEGYFLREWLKQITSKTNIENEGFVEEYTKLLILESKSNMFKNSLVFFSLQALSLVRPIEGLIASTANQFLLPKLTGKWKPAFFFNHLNKVIRKE